MKKVYIVAAIIIVAIIAGIFVINIYEADTEVTKQTTKVGVILNGSIDDHSWSQSHYEGLQQTAQHILESHSKVMKMYENVVQLVETYLIKEGVL